MYGTLISSATVGAGGATSIDFASIPGSFTDLVILISGRSSTSSGNYDWGIQVNGDSSTSKTARQLISGGTSVSSYTNTLSYAGYTGRVPTAADTASTFGMTQVYIPNYSGASTKTWLAETVAENNGTSVSSGVVLDLNTGSFGITSAITSLSVRYIVSGSMSANQYTTVYIYGISKGSGGATVS